MSFITEKFKRVHIINFVKCNAMKKIVLLIIGAITFIACSEESVSVSENQNVVRRESVNPELKIEAFLNSETYERHREFIINEFGEVDRENGITRSLEEYRVEEDVIIIPIKNDNEVIGVLEIVDLKRSGFLPNGDIYAINLVDYKDFDLNSKSGIIRMFDLNYGHSLHSELTVYDNIISDWETFPVLYDGDEPLITANGIYELCDSNGNGNIGLFECYSCGKNSLAGSGTFGEWFCDIPILGWSGCFTTLTAACIYISAVY